MVVVQGEVWWANLGEPSGSAPAFRRPVRIVQGESFHRSPPATVVCVPLTTHVKWAEVPGNVLLGESDTNLPKPSVANASQIVTT